MEHREFLVFPRVNDVKEIWEVGVRCGGTTEEYHPTKVYDEFPQYQVINMGRSGKVKIYNEWKMEVCGRSEEIESS